MFTHRIHPPTHSRLLDVHCRVGLAYGGGICSENAQHNFLSYKSTAAKPNPTTVLSAKETTQNDSKA